MKPPVLSDEEKLCCSLVDDILCYEELKPVIDETCIHQRDADVEWYEKNQEPHFITVPEIIIKTRQDTAREIFEAIERESKTPFNSYYDIKIIKPRYQALKSKYLKEK